MKKLLHSESRLTFHCKLLLPLCFTFHYSSHLPVKGYTWFMFGTFTWCKMSFDFHSGSLLMVWSVMLQFGNCYWTDLSHIAIAFCPLKIWKGRNDFIFPPTSYPHLLCKTNLSLTHSSWIYKESAWATLTVMLKKKNNLMLYSEGIIKYLKHFIQKAGSRRFLCWNFEYNQRK